jgi:baseplate J-like protein
MPLLTPILDDRSYQQLRDELVRRIPVYAPEWTDHNASDPGVTLIELFAFLAENLLFRFNQIPDATKLAFLKLLQVGLRPATAASAMVQMAPITVPAVEGRVLAPIRTKVKAGGVLFETCDEVNVLPLTVLGICKAKEALPTDLELLDFTERAIAALRDAMPQPQASGGTPSPTPAPVFYAPATVPPDPMAPGAAAVDFSGAVDRMIWVAVMKTKDTIASLLPGQTLCLGVVFDDQVKAGDPMQECLDRNQPATMDWQISTGRFDSANRPTYIKVEVKGDTTRGLTRSGIVKLAFPSSASDIGTFSLTNPDLAGTGELPPEIQDAEVAKTVLCWLRVSRPTDAAPFGRIAWIGANAAEVLQVRTASPEYLGMGTGEASQHYSLVNRPVIDGSLQLDVEEAAGWQRWTVVDTFDASSEDDRHYIIDLEAGTVTFGDGINGRAPQIAERIRAVEYRFGGGPEGNVAAAAINKFDGLNNLKVTNPLPAQHGADGEQIADALDRIPGELRRRDRAVTAGDFKELSLQTPGAAVGRAECLPRFHPSVPDQETPGVVSVVVWPREDRFHPNAPMPTRTLIQDVCSWLDARRLVTTSLYVIQPTYHPVAVAVGVQVKDGYGIEAVRRWTELVIRQYLAPLPPFGPEGDGWPLGRRVHAPELEAAALQVEGVEYLTGLKVAQLAAGGSWSIMPPDHPTVDLKSYEVVELRGITVVANMPPLDPGTPLTPPDSGAPPIPVPVLKEVCG